MTTPDPEQLYRTLDIMRKSGAQNVFMEASSHALYYEKLAPLKFECSVFTNLTPEHLDFHGSMEYYLNAKCKLFYASRLAVLNRDCEYYEAVRKCCERSVACSMRLEDADYLAGCIDISLDGGTRYTLKTRAESYDISSALVGEFNVMNTLQAIATAMELGVNISDIKRGLKAFCGVSGRLERVNVADGSRAVFIDYAHTPDALSNVLTTLTKLKKDGQRLTVLFGCGGDRDKSKRAEMGRIATTLADYTIITSYNCRSEARGGIISDILRGVGNSVNYTVVPDRKEALCLAAYLACQMIALSDSELSAKLKSQRADAAATIAEKDAALQLKLKK
jgi:UDP-N-acetylmuramoyl-L-alanyl-D-glutamate--2,6-diaminopimelate ligase